MTRVIAIERPPPAASTRLGFVVPGLGHVAAGQWTLGIGLLFLDVWLLWGAIAGFPRLGDVTGLTRNDGLRIHGFVAVVSWFVLAGGAWHAAWRLVHPLPPDPIRDNSSWGMFRKEFRRNRNGMLGWMAVLSLFAVTLIAPLLAPYDPDLVGVGGIMRPPDAAFLMGTDNYGRDLFSRVLMGARVSVSIGFIAVGIAATIGTSLGAIAGYFGGVTDRALMWFVDLLLSIPRLVLLLAIVGLFNPKGADAIFLIVIVLGLTGWMSVSRIVRSQVLSLKEQDFIQAARALGMSNRRIIFTHLIPNALAPVIVYGSLAVGGTMLAEASLSFLGLGVSQPTATWGSLINDGKDYLRTAPWIAFWPGLTIVYSVMAFNLLGDGLRDALDPKQRGQG